MTNDQNKLTDNQLDNRLSQLHKNPPELEVDLWPGIERKLPKQTHWWQHASGFSVAASLFVCALSLGYSVFLHQDNNELRTQLATTVTSDILTPQNNTQTTISAIPVSLGNQSCSESPEEAVIRENLLIIEMALVQIKTALKESPNDPTLNKRLLDLSKQQINLVSRANTIAL